MKKIKISQSVLVEGKYDKIKLQSILDAKIFTTDGFSIFNNKEKRALLARIAEKHGILIVTDSDSGGFLIRNKLRGSLPNRNITHLYIPKIEGKEQRKSKKAREGFLGVEGMPLDLLRALFLPFASEGTPAPRLCPVTKLMFYEAGLSGKPGSRQKRDAIAAAHSLPTGMSANALIEAMNLLGIPL